MRIHKEYDFDDVLILPKDDCNVKSRTEVSLSQQLGTEKRGFKLDLPIIGSPMKGIMDATLALQLGKLGGVGILHRFYDKDSEWKSDINSLRSGKIPFGVAIGLNDNTYSYALDEGANIICIDIANGHLNYLRTFVSEVASYIFNNNYNSLLMAGNIVTETKAYDLFESGADLLRVGIGSGALCTTRNFTGIGRPQITAINECSNHSFNNVTRSIVADGGIRNSGDIVKAIVAGANTVMVGSFLAQAVESANNGIIFGMASERLQEDYFHSVNSIEGISVELESTITLEELLNQTTKRIKSGFTYLGAKNITDAQTNPRFVEVGKSSIKEL